MLSSFCQAKAWHLQGSVSSLVTTETDGHCSTFITNCPVAWSVERPYQVVTPLFITSFPQRFQFCHYFSSTISLSIDLFFWTVCLNNLWNFQVKTRETLKVGNFEPDPDETDASSLVKKLFKRGKVIIRLSSVLSLPFFERFLSLLSDEVWALNLHQKTIRFWFCIL